MTLIRKNLQKLTLNRRAPVSMRMKGEGMALGLSYKEPEDGQTWGPYETGCRLAGALCYDVSMQRFDSQLAVRVFMEEEPAVTVHPIQVVATLYAYYALLSDGTVIPVVHSSYNYGQNDCSAWASIDAIDASGSYVLGAKQDGTVVFAGTPFQDANYAGFSAWSGIQRVVAASSVAVGITGGSPQIATYPFSYWQSVWSGAASLTNVVDFDWHDHGAGAAGGVFVHTDGTCTYHGQSASSSFAQVSSLSGVQQVACGYYDSIGLRADGTCVAVGEDYEGMKTAALGWSDLVYIAAFADRVYGVKSDGSVVAGGKAAVPTSFLNETILALDLAAAELVALTSCKGIANASVSQDAIDLAALATSQFNYCF